jgi:PAS domain S-box-containing protein
MTPTPPLRRRVVAGGVGVVAVVLLLVNTAVYVAFGTSLRMSLEALLDERARSVRAEAQEVRAEGRDLAELARRLQARGVRATIRAPDGTTYNSDPTSPVTGGLPTTAQDDEFVSRTLQLPGGGSAQVLARSAVRGALQRLLLLQLASSLVAIGVAALLLSQASRRALRPIDDIVAVASRTAAGESGERLRPDRPETELGRVAAAYDAVLDALEAGYKVAAKLERRSGMLEMRWRQVLEAAGEAYVSIDARGEVVDWNHRAEELFGWPADEIVGTPAARLVAPQQRDRFLAEVAELGSRAPAPVAVPYLLDAVARDGRTFPAEITVWGWERRSGTVVHAFVRDVAARRQTEDALARLAAVVEGSSDAIVTKSLDGVILTWNAAAERMYGWTAKEAVGRHISFLVPGAEMSTLSAMLERVAQGERVAGWETQRVTRAGTLLPVSTLISPVHDRQGRVVAASAISRDVTEQRWMAETLDTTLSALQTALDEARASEETTARFLADAAHQLRTPMAGIRACAETLLRGADPPDADRLLATMVRETSRAARLISSLLRIARLEQGELGAPAQPVDVVAVCRAEVERLSLLSPDLRVELEAPAAPAGPLMLDSAGLQEILSNLGDNARRHAASEIRVTVAVADQQLRIAVLDDGPGIPAERVEEVFGRFVSLDGRGGSGLGLPIARGLAQSYGGDLVYDRGFVLTLPAVPVTD